MASETDICNLALLKYGDKRINSIDEGSVTSINCKILYPLLRDQLTASHPWNFAMKRADISSQLLTTPPFEWDYAYQLPADCLRAWELYGVDAEWVVENGELLTNIDSEVYIRYIAKVDQAGKFPPAYCTALSVLLAAELANKLGNDKDRRFALLKEFEDYWLPEAQRLNAIEGVKPKRKGEREIANDEFSWVTTR